MVKKILVAFDGSEKSYEAFDFAVEMAMNCPNSSTEVLVLAVAQPPEPIDIVEMDAVIETITQHYEELFKGLVEKAREKGVAIKAEVVVGHPAEQIVRYAADNACDMIVLGHRGRSKIADWLLGSVSKRVSSYSPCTVTIVK
jgi:nucleotide-binding universal stress UspA family protein